jgi:hypothetical protein
MDGDRGVAKAVAIYRVGSKVGRIHKGLAEFMSAVLGVAVESFF